jgi:multidrug efflux pump subunit AcrA (membrane-fusion protein)
MSTRTRPRWYLIALAAAGVALLVGGALEVGPPSSSARTSRQIITAQRGVVQSTVSATGNLTPGVDVQANFRTSGTLSSVYVHVGQHVRVGQLLATLDPTADQLAVDQAQQSLNAARDQLTSAENGTSSSGGSSSTGASAGASGATATGASTSVSASAQFVAETIGSNQVAQQTRSTPSTTTPQGTTTAPTTTTPGKAKPTAPTSTRTKSTGTGTTTTGTTSTAARSSSASAKPTATTQTSTTTTPSPATIASAKASVDGAEASLRNAQTALAETRLVAPSAGTIVSLASLSPGDPVSASSGSGAASAASSSTGSSTSGGASSGSGSTSAGSLGGTSSSSSSSASTSTGFAEIVDTGHMTMTVALSESDVSKVRVGQTATVSLDALTGVQLAAHVASISTLGTTSSGVVSYNAVLDLDESNSQVKAGMSASASIIVHQASGVTLPNSAVTGTGSLSTVKVLRGGRTVSTPVVVGLQGDSRTQIVSGLSAGAQVVVTTTLPALGASSTSSGTGSGTLGGGAARPSGFGGGGFGGGGGGFGGGGGGRATGAGGAAAGGG